MFPDYLSVSYDYGLMFFSVDNKTKFKKQNSFCSKIYKKEQNNFFSDLELNKITDKLFLKTWKPLLSGKCIQCSTISLVDNELAKLLIAALRKQW